MRITKPADASEALAFGLFTFAVCVVLCVLGYAQVAGGMERFAAVMCGAAGFAVVAGVRELRRRQDANKVELSNEDAAAVGAYVKALGAERTLADFRRRVGRVTYENIDELLHQLESEAAQLVNGERVSRAKQGAV